MSAGRLQSLHTLWLDPEETDESAILTVKTNIWMFILIYLSLFIWQLGFPTYFPSPRQPWEFEINFDENKIWLNHVGTAYLQKNEIVLK